MPLHQPYIVTGGIVDDFELTVCQRAHTPDRPPQPEIAALQAFSLRHQGTRAQHGRGFQHRTIKNRRPHADKTPIGDFATVQHDPVTDSHPVANQQGAPPRQIVTVVGDVQHRAILDIAARSDLNVMHITPDHAHWPDRALGCDTHVTDDHGRLIDPGIGSDLGNSGFERADIGHGNRR